MTDKTFKAGFPIRVEYGAFKFELAAAEVPGAKAGDASTYKYGITHPPTAADPENDTVVDAVAQAVQDFADRDSENQAVQVELTNMRAASATSGSAEDVKKARETVRKNREAAAKVKKPSV
jgi:malonyl CoA-acyl carrier protein transacylase